MKNKKIIIGFIFILVIVSIVIGFFYFKNKLNQNDIKGNVVSLGKCEFNIEKAKTEEERKRGLSNRDSLCENCGMLFSFDKEDRYFFWMKDMRFPIDIIWIRNNKVVEISQDVSQYSKSVHSSKEDADKVLEINANGVGKCKIKIGDKLKD